MIENGLLIFVKRECPACELVAPVLGLLLGGLQPVALYSQDDPSFPPRSAGARESGLERCFDDRSLEQSWRWRVETTPTLIRVRDGREVERTVGWDLAEWTRISERTDLSGFTSGLGLPSFRPG